MIALRPYQEEAVQCCFALWQQDVRNLLLVAAVGAGKTIIAATIMKRHLIEKANRVLFLAHREELLSQTVEKLAMIDPQITAGIEQGRNICPPEAQVMVASIATVKKLERVARWSPLSNITLIIIDECHHATSSTYLEVLHAISRHNTRRHLLGITATPIRMDGENLSLIFDRLSYRIDMPALIDLGYLCPIRGYTIQTNTSIANVPFDGDGEYDQDKLATAIDNLARNQAIVKSYLHYGERRPAIAFVANVAHAEHLAAEFRRNGIQAQTVSSRLHKDERRQILDDYQRGQISVLTNCNVLTEGFDAPLTGCVIIAKPTRSPVVYPQSIGRGLRLHPSKRDCLIIDLVDLCTQNVITLPKIFNLPENLQLKGENLRQVQRTVELARASHPHVDWQLKAQFTTENIRKLLQPPDFFHLAQTIVPDDSTALSWMPLEKQFVCVVNLRDHRIARLVRDDLGVWHFFFGKVHSRLGSKKQEALRAGTDHLLAHLTEDEKGQLASHPKGNGPPTNEQRKILKDYGIAANAGEHFTEAGATRLIQKLDFLKYVFRLNGQFQSGRYLGQTYEMVWFFDPDYVEAVGKVNRLIADRTQPLQTLQWLRKTKPDLFATNLLPPFEDLLEICRNQSNRYHSIVRNALEHTPEFLQMNAQFRQYRGQLAERRRSELKTTRNQHALPAGQ